MRHPYIWAWADLVGAGARERQGWLKEAFDNRMSPELVPTRQYNWPHVSNLPEETRIVLRKLIEQRRGETDEFRRCVRMFGAQRMDLSDPMTLSVYCTDHGWADPGDVALLATAWISPEHEGQPTREVAVLQTQEDEVQIYLTMLNDEADAARPFGMGWTVSAPTVIAEY